MLDLQALHVAVNESPQVATGFLAWLEHVADWNGGSAEGSCAAPVASHSGGPRVGTIRNGAVGPPRMSRTVEFVGEKSCRAFRPPQLGRASVTQSLAIIAHR